MKTRCQNSGLVSLKRNCHSMLWAVVFFMGIIGFSSCLTVESKEYTYELTDNNSGKLTIKYVNIYSIMDDGKDVSADDFKELVDKYLQGNQIMEEFPNATNIKSRLFEENGYLCGEVTLDFTDLNSARLYQFDKTSPIMMNISTAFDSESYAGSNGVYGNEHMPVVFWPSDSKKLTVTTSISKPDETGVNLLNEYRIWLATKQ